MRRLFEPVGYRNHCQGVTWLLHEGAVRRDD
jgi:hypothetical protein